MIKNIEISDSAALAIDVLTQNGYSAYVVGGAVRDALIKRKTNDFDVATDATPKDVIRVFSNFQVLLTGEKHGTVTVMLSEPIEITTFRTEGIYEDLRRPSNVEFISSLGEDLKRRDFTMNALAYDGKGEIIDLYGGISDINAKIIKTVGDPEKRFGEDALRILRAVRFASVLGFKIEENTLNAAIKLKSNLQAVSKERIFAELEKILQGEYVIDTLMNYSEIIFEIVPELRPCYKFEQHINRHKYDVYEHIVRSVGAVDNEKKLRLAMFFHDSGKPQKFFIDENGTGHFYNHSEVSAAITLDALKRLKAPNKLINEVVWLVANHHLDMKNDRIKLKRLLSEHGEERIAALLRVKCADCMAKGTDDAEQTSDEIKRIKNTIDEILRSGECLTVSDLAVGGDDLAELGFKGESIGKTLQALLNDVICGNLPNERERLIKSAKKRAEKYE